MIDSRAEHLPPAVNQSFPGLSLFSKPWPPRWKSPGTFEERPETGKHRHISKRRTEHFDFSECRKLKLTPRRKHAATNLTLGEPQEACMFPATIMEDLEMAEEKEIMLWNKITYRGNKLHFLVQKSWVWPVNPPRPRPRPLQANLASVSGRQHNLKHTTQSTSRLLYLLLELSGLLFEKRGLSSDLCTTLGLLLQVLDLSVKGSRSECQTVTHHITRLC